MAPLYFVTERKGIKRKYAILVKNGDRYRGFFKEELQSVSDVEQIEFCLAIRTNACMLIPKLAMTTPNINDKGPNQGFFFLSLTALLPCAHFRRLINPAMDHCKDFDTGDRTSPDAFTLAARVQFQSVSNIQIILNEHVHPQFHHLGAVTKAQSVFHAFATSTQEEHLNHGLTVSVVGKTRLPGPVQIWSQEYSRLMREDDDTVWIDKGGLDPNSQRSLEGLLDQALSDCMLVPIKRPDNHQFFLVVALVNKQEGHDAFGSLDLQAVHQCFQQVLGTLVGAVELEEERRLREQCQSLLAVAKNLFSHLDDVELLLKEIMSQARHLTKAERCSLFLLDKQHKCLVAKVFDGTSSGSGQWGTTDGRQLGIPADQGIAGHVAITGQLLNISDAYAHPLFYQDVDKTTGFKTRNILCFPIKDGDDVLGVAELCNKTSAPCFTRADEELAMSFSIYCGISLVHGLMYKKVRDAQHRSHLSNELMMYHMKVSNEETLKLLQEESMNMQKIDINFCEFRFVPRSMEELKTSAAVVAVFQDLGLKERWSINQETLSRFVLMVRKGYRDPPYHNWMHAFSVFHFSYLLIKRLRLVQQDYFTDLEALALLVSSLCHDVDHRGTTNSFQLASNSVLAALYSSEGSVMERHHFAQSMCILNTEGCNIFENLSSKDYTRCLDLMQDIILATDLAHHLRIFRKLKDLATSGFDKSRAEHHQLLLFLMMTAADLSDQTKDWKSSRNAALLVYREFFSQGDLEKAMGNRPVEMMDRDKACIPTLQIQFIDDVALPVYSLLAQLFPELSILVDTVNSNRERWVTLEDGHVVSPMEILTNDID
ncbi:putative cAMP and cAMP-inhibited cGMP 3',5'-cyclic phosphodiesterase 10A [Daphnia magna]|uniref:Phosphodiesterase n=1 Tax=Daphnia magna TaxID=35525 RepID=A0A164STZ7_9CRUS|nr:putative cAMP and cAMP-inhibited cGMP 3',5'-cyclic phosphodiesterase 10A [Daphnia magna]